jgi:hypothetical protein
MSHFEYVTTFCVDPDELPESDLTASVFAELITKFYTALSAEFGNHVPRVTSIDGGNAATSDHAFWVTVWSWDYPVIETVVKDFDDCDFGEEYPEPHAVAIDRPDYDPPLTD